MTPERPSRFGWILLVLLLAFAFQGSRHVWDPDEGRYTAVALNMLRTGDWLVPRLHDEHLHFTKPPVTYWALGVSMLLLGKNEWAARAPNALAFLGTIFLVFLLGRSIRPRSPGLPALVYATTILPFGAANLVTTDTILVFFETLAALAFWKWEESGGKRGFLLLFWGGLGLAFLTKGPPGLIPLLPALAYLLIRKGARASLRLFHPAGLLAFLVLGGAWYALVIWKTPGLLDYFLEKEVVGRIFTGMHRRNARWYKAFVVYIPTLLLGGLPWAWFLLGAWRKGAGLLEPSRWKELSRREPALFFLLLWFLLPLPVFFLATSRLPLYILPLFVPLAILSASRIPPSPSFPSKWKKALLAWSLLLIAAKGACAFLPYPKDPVPLARFLRGVHPSPIQEVVFYCTHPRYGLAFYLDTEVEEVFPHPRPPSFPSPFPPQTLSQELEEKEPHSLLLARRECGKEAERILLEKGLSPTSLGTFGKYRVFQIRP